MGNSKALPKGYHQVMVYLNIKNAAKAIDFYKNAFGAEEVGRLSMPDGKVAHAEVRLGDTIFMLAEESDAWGNKSPETLGGSPVNLCIYCEDVDAMFKKAIQLGAKVDRGMEPKDQFYGDRSGTLLDPFGHRWTIATHIEDVSWEEMRKRMEKMMSEQSQN